MSADTTLWRRFSARARLAWPLLLAGLCFAAVGAIFAGANGVLFVAFCGVALLLLLARRPVTPEPRPQPPVPRAPERTAAQDLDYVTATLGAVDLPVFVYRRDSTLVFQNRAAERAFGAMVAGLHISTRWRSPGILDMVRETIATDEPNQIEHSERLPSERVYIVRSAPVELPAGAAGRDRLYLLSFRDVSEVRRMDRMRSDFVANASHELRTPLASLRGFIETLQGPARSDPRAQEQFLSIMFDQTNRMSRLVDDLLSLSRLETKAHVAPDQTVDLVSVLGHVRDSLQPLARDLDVDVRLHLPDMPRIEVVGERDELVQVFENLIENACKYGQEGGAVDVYLVGDGTRAPEVRVIDYGPGIPAEHVPRLTERFYRVSVADSRSKKGTGLGLAIVKHILSRHRARLLVRSEVGKGAEFTVRF